LGAHTKHRLGESPLHAFLINLQNNVELQVALFLGLKRCRGDRIGVSNRPSLGDTLGIENSRVFYFFPIANNFLCQPAVIALQGNVLTGFVPRKLAHTSRKKTKTSHYIEKIPPVIYGSDLLFSHTTTLFQ